MYELNRRSWYSFSLLLLIGAYTLTSSCASSKRIYFRNINNDSITAETPPVVMTQITPFTDPKIESNDVLAITVQTIAQNEGSNTPITTNSTGNFNPLNGFLVDKDGYIELSLIGKVHVAGLTTSEAREIIKQKADTFWVKSVVNVRISNFEIQVMGDVAKPGTVTSASEKISILDAIAVCGDLNLTAKRKNILLVRTEGDQKKFVRFDLTNTAIFQSPYFYLKQRDLIYVEPSRTKIETSNSIVSLYLGYFSAAISIVSALYIFKVIK